MLLVIAALLVILTITVLAIQVIRPIIITYPWPRNDDYGSKNLRRVGEQLWRKEKSKQVVILAGSYNPPHSGHLAMLEYLSERCVKEFCIMT